MGQTLLDNRIILCPYRIRLFTYGVSYGSITINLWNYIFDYIIPYIEFTGPIMEFVFVPYGICLVPYGVSYGTLNYHFIKLLF